MNVLTVLCLLASLTWGLTFVSSSSPPSGDKYRSTSVASQLRALIDEEQTLRQRLQTKVQRLRNEAAALNSTIAPCSCPSALPPASSSKPVAYVGTLPATKSSLTANTVFNFTNDLLNIGLPFKATTGHFVAPVSGLYAFSLAIFMNPGYWSEMQLIQNGNPFLLVRTGHYKYSSTNRQVNMATNYAIVNATAGDEVWPQYVSGSKYIWADGVTTFTGVLIHEF